MSSTSDFVTATLADALLPLFRRPVEDVILETLDRRQVPSRTDFKEIRDLVNTLRGQIGGSTSGTTRLAERADAVEDTLQALTERVDALERGAGLDEAAVARLIDARLAPVLAHLSAAEARTPAAAAPATPIAATNAATKQATTKKAAPKKAAPKKAASRKAGAAPKRVLGVAQGKICQVTGCDADVRSKGFCSRHYQAWRRGVLEGFPFPG